MSYRKRVCLYLDALKLGIVVLYSKVKSISEIPCHLQTRAYSETSSSWWLPHNYTLKSEPTYHCQFTYISCTLQLST